MNLSEALKKYPEDETELFLSHLLKWDKTKLYTNPGKKLSVEQVKKLSELIRKLRNHWPVAYLLGYKYFYGLKFKITKDTLIPRPETEWIIDEAIALSRKLKNPKVLDIGTGSGCIAVSIASSIPRAEVIASDISSKALVIAKSNAKTHKTKVKFIKANLLPKTDQSFDIIIANLPYVPKSFYNKNYTNLKHEPKSALVDRNRNGDLYIELLNQIKKSGQLPKHLIFEIDPELVSLLRKSTKLLFPKSKIRIIKDLNKLDRFIVIDF